MSSGLWSWNGSLYPEQSSFLWFNYSASLSMSSQTITSALAVPITPCRLSLSVASGSSFLPFTPSQKRHKAVGAPTSSSSNGFLTFWYLDPVSVTHWFRCYPNPIWSSTRTTLSYSNINSRRLSLRMGNWMCSFWIRTNYWSQSSWPWHLRYLRGSCSSIVKRRINMLRA